MEKNKLTVPETNFPKFSEGERDKEIDILKGLAIILVVVGHTWPPFRNYIYLFHLAVFMMASGYCWKDSVENVPELKKYLIRKLKRLYIPFIICNGTYNVLNNFFITINIYSDNMLFLELTKDAKFVQSITEIKDFYHFCLSLCKTFLFLGVTQLGSASWFLCELFLVTCFHATFFWLLNKVYSGDNTLIIVVLLIFNLFLSSFIPVHFPELLGEIRRFFCTYSAYLLGVLIKKYDKRFNSVLSTIISFGGIILLNNYEEIELSAAKIGNPVLYIICSIMGWYLLIGLSAIILKYTKYINRWLIYVGRHTMPILCLHLLAFKLVSLIYILGNDRPQILLASFHILFETPEYYWILYTVVGVIIPLVVYQGYEICRIKLIKVFL